MTARKRISELARQLLDEGRKRDRDEFNKLVGEGVFKDTDEDYTKFVICKYCNCHDHATNACTITPERSDECPLPDKQNKQISQWTSRD